VNKRIRELLGQAYDEAVPETWTTLSSEQLGRIHEKFAELIIQECMDVLEDFTTDINVRGNEYTVVDARETLEEHFGLE